MFTSIKFGNKKKQNFNESNLYVKLLCSARKKIDYIKQVINQ